MKPKLKRKEIFKISGSAGIMLAIYMLATDQNAGFIPLIIGVILVWLGYKK
jgi:hypothetical protein